MDAKDERDARRWLARQLAWEESLNRLVRDWEKREKVPEVAARVKRPAPRRRSRRAGLPLQKPAA